MPDKPRNFAIALLLSATACTSGVDVNDKGALLVAIKRDDARLVKRYLASGLNPSDEIEGKPLLWHAYNQPHAAVARALIEGGADCNGQIKTLGGTAGRPLFFNALGLGRIAVVNACLDRNVDLSWKDDKGWGFFEYALVGGDLTLLELARKHGFQSTDKTRGGRNALHNLFYVITASYVAEKTRLLIAWGVNVNEEDDDGYRPIDYAARNNIYWNESEEAAIALIEAGSGTTLKPYLSGTTEVKQSLPYLAGHWALPRLSGVLLDQARKTGVLDKVCGEIANHIGDRREIDLLQRNQMQTLLRRRGCA